jgi:hypothetical protein
MMNKIIDENNLGAALLEIGYYTDARAVLNGGLAQLRSYNILQNDGQASDDTLEAANVSNEQGDHPDNIEEDSTAPLLDAGRTFEKACCSEKTARRRGKSYNADLNQDFVYRHPIFITSESACENERTVFITSESDCKNEAALVVILIFNMALSQHLAAMDLKHDDAKRSLLLTGAEKLYKLGYAIVHVKDSDVELSLTYSMATLNNLAQISKELNNELHSERLSKQLLRSLMIIIDSAATDEIDEMDGFMRNASKTILRDCKFAKAA